MEWEMRPIEDEDDEYEAWTKPMVRTFGFDFSKELPKTRGNFEFDRALGVIDKGEFVAATHAYSLEMQVPGNVLPMAGVSHVCVQASHRRRGIMTAMTKRQFQDFHDRGEPIAGLGASESIIYGRFGYGIATHRENWTIAKEHTAFNPPIVSKGQTRFVDTCEMRNIFPEVYERTGEDRPGWVPRPGYVWDFIASDYDFKRHGCSANYYVVYEEDGNVDGYVNYRTIGDAVRVIGLMATSRHAYASLWQFCFGIDLKSVIDAPNRPVDDPLMWMLADPRRLQRSTEDAKWLRLVDAPVALSSRRYSQRGSLVIELRDTFCPWNEGRYELEGGPDGAECRGSSKSPDLALSASELGATYLGGVKFSTLASAGRIEEHTHGALERADAMFAYHLKPWCAMGW
ncbi:MAG: GNAT family N-acetyltransferase [Candidatus Poribacteria bacterium]|nr:GNAT family N-acetyltransferase [Candidatus Poribacteria bacterium]